jgi:hypothetical protein
VALRERLRRLAAALILPACGLAACAPPIPAMPEDGYVVISRSVSARLDRVPGEGAWSGIDPASLERAVSASGADAGRPAAIEIDGHLSESQRRDVMAEILDAMPQASVRFGPGGSGPLQMTIRYHKAIATRCAEPDDWMADGLMPPGCASAMAVGQMVADPDDLVRPEQMGPAALQPLAQDAIHYLDQEDAPAEGQGKPQQAQQGTGTNSVPDAAPDSDASTEAGH